MLSFPALGVPEGTGHFCLGAVGRTRASEPTGSCTMESNSVIATFFFSVVLFFTPWKMFTECEQVFVSRMLGVCFALRDLGSFFPMLSTRDLGKCSEILPDVFGKFIVRGK